MLRRVRLYGLAGQTFGRSFELDVSSVAEATRALSVLLKGFREFVEKHSFRIVCGNSLKKGLNLGEDDVHFSLPNGDLHVVPVTAGAKKGGLFKIIAGVFLLAAAFFVPFAAPGLATTLGMSTVGGVSFIGSFAAAGLGLIIQGVTQMMTKTPKKPEEKDDKSYTIDGQLNVVEQGGPVPLVYGRTVVGSTLISAGITTVEYQQGSSDTSGGGIPGQKATGTVTFNTKPNIGDTLSLNGLKFVFTNQQNAPYPQVRLGADPETTLDNLLAVIYGSVDARLKVASYSRAAKQLKIVYKTPGKVGNAYTLAKTTILAGTAITLSGATLTGGTDV